jgi:soluble lytic murein transglycosylase-like protein
VAVFFGLLLATWAGGLSDYGDNASAQAISSGNANGQIAPLFTPEIQYWAASLRLWAEEHGLDPNLAATVMQIESCGHPEIRSNAGATGLFQVMPFHFTALEIMTNPDTNALRGLDYLRRSLEYAKGDARLAFAGYNGGIGVIDSPEADWANETQRYVYWASGIYADASQNLSQSARLAEWLTAGGASLCAKARSRLGILQ